MITTKLNPDVPSVDDIYKSFARLSISLDRLKHDIHTRKISFGMLQELGISFFDTIEEVAIKLHNTHIELEQSFILNIISHCEALLRSDFVIRVQGKKKDSLSRAFQEIHKSCGNRIRFSEDILDNWKSQHPCHKKDIGLLEGILEFRHWLAHGRYWKRKSTNTYSVDDAYTISRKIHHLITTYG